MKPFIISTCPAGRSLQCEALMTGYLYIFMAHPDERRRAKPCPTLARQQPVCAGRHQVYPVQLFADISVDDIAKAVGVSRSHLYRVFMSDVGQSPIDYLTGYRISEACSLLKIPGCRLRNRRIRGLFDQFYFSRVFKKVKGVPRAKVPCRAGKDPQLGLVFIFTQCPTIRQHLLFWCCRSVLPAD